MAPTREHLWQLGLVRSHLIRRFLHDQQDPSTVRILGGPIAQASFSRVEFLIGHELEVIELQSEWLRAQFTQQVTISARSVDNSLKLDNRWVRRTPVARLPFAPIYLVVVWVMLK